jgi:uncharacterized protein YceH (UPF0502 family)
MEFTLNAIEARILGVLIEKQMSTPDYYPLTLNSLVNACNQKSNRNPVMNLDENAVEQALGSLREQHLVWQVKTDGSRMPKFEHNIVDVADFSKNEMGILCSLLIRGPQTAGELRSRTSRFTEFHGLAAVEHTLLKLTEHEKGPFVVKLPRQPGHKECRYSQLFCGAVRTETADELNSGDLKTPDTSFENDKIVSLEKRVDDLQAELNELKTQFSEFKSQFE